MNDVDGCLELRVKVCGASQGVVPSAVLVGTEFGVGSPRKTAADAKRLAAKLARCQRQRFWQRAEQCFQRGYTSLQINKPLGIARGHATSSRRSSASCTSSASA